MRALLGLQRSLTSCRFLLSLESASCTSCNCRHRPAEDAVCCTARWAASYWAMKRRKRRSASRSWEFSSIAGYSFTRSSTRKSCNSTANSTPVGPPPIITKWRIFLFSSSLRLGSDAFSKQSITLFRIFWASSTTWHLQCEAVSTRYD